LALEIRAQGTTEVVERFRTLDPPPGPQLCRIASISDSHVGERAFGVLGTMRERRVDVPYPLRCLRAALAEAQAWAPDAIVAKGDLTKHGRVAEFEAVGAALSACAVPVEAILGNHDTEEDSADGALYLGRAGVEVSTEPRAVDLPGARIILADSTKPPTNRGWLGDGRREAIVELAAGADRPVLVFMHHYLQRYSHWTHWPPGVPGPQADRLMEDLVRVCPDVFVTCGHSHRSRAYRRAGAWVTEVGSTKDYPGVWAGYAVHEGGIRQVVRRVQAPDCIAWTEHTARAVGGLWRLWSPGSRDQRCFTAAWSRNTSAARG
jgi:predicted phosphodiesterase